MLRRRYGTKEAALKAANDYLTKEPGEYIVTEKTVTMESDENEDEELFTIVRVKDSSSFAMIFKFDFQDEWMLKAYKDVKFTYPFRCVSEKGLYLLCGLNSIFYKPVKEISIDEARTPEGAMEIYSFFGKEISQYSKNHDEVIEDDDGNLLFYSSLSSLMEDVTGKRIKSAEEYIEAVSAILGKSLSDDQRKQAYDYYRYTEAEYFLEYALYEFLRTESYRHLQEILSGYERFDLPKDWACRHFPLAKTFDGRNTGAEEFIITRYLSNEAREKVGVKSYREIAELTEIPLNLIYKALKSRDIW